MVSLQASQGGSAYFAGKGVKDSAEKREASVGGAIAAAHFIRAVAPLYGIPVIRTSTRSSCSRARSAVADVHF
jgi:fructose-bisphosphate aldolase class II